MRLPALVLLLPGICVGGTTGMNASYTDNFAYENAADPNPVLDELGATLALGSVIQLGYFTISDTADPGIWDTFVALTGDGSDNAAFFDTRIGDGTDDPNPGYWNFSATFDDGIHSNVPSGAVRIGIRIYNGNSVGGSTHFNTVTSSGSSWILPAPANPPFSPFPANADLDSAVAGGTATWQSGDSGFAITIPLTTPAVTPVITSIVATGNADEFELTYDATAGVALDIETSALLTTPSWSEVGDTTPAAATGNTVTVTTGPTDGERFWRLRVQP